MLKWKWEKTGRSVSADMTVVTYETQDDRYRIESRKRTIKHANGIGVWYFTTFFLIDEMTGYEEEFRTLKDAKAAAEGDWNDTHNA